MEVGFYGAHRNKASLFVHFSVLVKEILCDNVAVPDIFLLPFMNILSAYIPCEICSNFVS
jgi:hypothetical protein